MLRKSMVAIGLLLALSLANGFAAQTPEPEKKIPGIAEYRKWTLVNAKPYHVPSSLSFLCAAPTDDTMKRFAEEKKKNPHLETYIRVYVNPVGEKAFLNPKETDFPAGTVIVKEKRPTEDETKPESPKKPELMTVMVKRKAGFDKKNGDWDYFVLSGDAKKLLPGTKKHCQECHQRVEKSGYLYRPYLPVSPPQ